MEEEDPKTRPDISGGSYCSICAIWLLPGYIKSTAFCINLSKSGISRLMLEECFMRQSQYTSKDSGNLQLGLISLSVFGTISFELG